MTFKSSSENLSSKYATYADIDNQMNNETWSWGWNCMGQLGHNTSIPLTLSSTQTAPNTTKSSSTTPITFSQASCGELHSIFLTPEGWLYASGYGTEGQIGNNTGATFSRPTYVGSDWAWISAGGRNGFGIKTNGTLWGWGDNTYGQLGDNTTTKKSSPVQTVAGGTNWKAVASNSPASTATSVLSPNVGTVAAIKTDGTLWLWGNNGNGQLGDNTITHKSSPVQTVAGGTNWKSVSCGYLHTAAIKTNGTLWTWGYNGTGCLGDNTIVNQSSPVQTVAGGTNWKSVSCGGYGTAAIKTDGTLWTWGYNFHGQLGDNTTVAKSSPVQTVAGGTNWKSVSRGAYHVGAIKTDGTLWLWGYNSEKQLGTTDNTSRSSPVQFVAVQGSWKSVACGGNHTIATLLTNT